VSLKPERWGSPLVQEKYQEEKACDRRHTYCIIIIIIIIISIGFASKLRILADKRMAEIKVDALQFYSLSFLCHVVT